VHVGAGDVDGVIARLRRGDFTGGRPVHDFVLLLQEEFRAGAEVPAALPHGFHAPSRIAPATIGRTRHGVHALETAEPVSLVYVPSMRNGGIAAPVEDRGNAIVSSLPLEDLTAIELPIEHQRRVAVAATVHGRAPGGAAWTLRLVDVHLDTAMALLHGGPFGARRRQAEALVSALGGGGPPTVVAGDLNTWGGARESVLALLRRAFPVVDARFEEAHVATFDGPLGFHAALDHVFARGVTAIAVRRLDERFGSDHFPLLVEVRF